MTTPPPPVTLRRCDRGPAAACEAILRSLPEWFGIESAIVRYVADLRERPAVVAEGAGRIVGFVSLHRHFPGSAELAVLGVHPEFHRRGIGRRMIAEAEAWSREDGVRVMQVKTMGPSRPNAEYAATLAFYRSIGYEPVEEFTELWGDIPCLLLVKSIGGAVGADATDAADTTDGADTTRP